MPPELKYPSRPERKLDLAAQADQGAGAAAALARKGSARHIRAGRWYYRAITATAGYLRRRCHRPGDTGHIAGMGIGYTAMLTAFYVDNGPHLPPWDRLPVLAFWLLPAAIAAPIITRAVIRARNKASPSARRHHRQRGQASHGQTRRETPEAVAELRLRVRPGSAAIYVRAWLASITAAGHQGSPTVLSGGGVAGYGRAGCPAEQEHGASPSASCGQLAQRGQAAVPAEARWSPGWLLMRLAFSWQAPS